MRRWVFHFLAGVSGVVFLLSVVMWVRGYWVYDEICRYTVGHTIGVGSGLAELGVFWSWGPELRDHSWRYHQGTITETYDERQKYYELVERAVGARRWKGPGFTVWRYTIGSERISIVSVWNGSIVALSALLPAWWTIWFLRWRRRVREGCCQKCGYDLRASVGRCPECGVGIAGRVHAVRD